MFLSGSASEVIDRKRLDREISAVYEGENEATKESHKVIESTKNKQ